MTLEQDLKQILQPHVNNMTDYSNKVKSILERNFPEIKEVDKEETCSIDTKEFYDTILANKGILKDAKKEFDAVQAKIVVPEHIKIEYFSPNGPDADLWNNMFIENIQKGNDEWNVPIVYYSEYLNIETQLLAYAPGSVPIDETYIFIHRRNMSDLKYVGDLAFTKEFSNGTFNYNGRELEGQFIANCSPQSTIKTELKRFHDSREGDLDTVNFKISELGSGALDAILYNLRVQKLEKK